MLLAIVLVPTLSFAQTIGVNANTCKSLSQDITLGGVQTTGIAAIICKIAAWVNLIIPIVIGLAVIVSVWD